MTSGSVAARAAAQTPPGRPGSAPEARLGCAYDLLTLKMILHLYQQQDATKASIHRDEQQWDAGEVTGKAAGHELTGGEARTESRHIQRVAGSATHTVPVEWVNFCRVFVKL